MRNFYGLYALPATDIFRFLRMSSEGVGMDKATIRADYEADALSRRLETMPSSPSRHPSFWPRSAEMRVSELSQWQQQLHANWPASEAFDELPHRLGHLVPFSDPLL